MRDVDADVVLNGITGSVGLGPTLATLERGTTLALANKESLIVGGDLVTRLAAPGQIVPVDSEHSAIAQALRSGTDDEVRRLVLTASGGPFRGRTPCRARRRHPGRGARAPDLGHGARRHHELGDAREQGPRGHRGAPALRRRRTTASRSSVHPQSIVHSMVEFIDGSTIAQASPPDMRLPISLGLDWPHRVGGVGRPLDWTTAHELDVRAARRRRVPGRRAREAGRPGRRRVPRGVQRRERAGGRRLPRRTHRLPRHRRHRARRRRVARGDRRHAHASPRSPRRRPLRAGPQRRASPASRAEPSRVAP